MNFSMLVMLLAFIVPGCTGFLDTTIENGTIIVREYDHLIDAMHQVDGSISLAVNTSDVAQIPYPCPHQPFIPAAPDRTPLEIFQEAMIKMNNPLGTGN